MEVKTSDWHAGMSQVCGIHWNGPSWDFLFNQLLLLEQINLMISICIGYES